MIRMIGSTFITLVSFLLLTGCEQQQSQVDTSNKALATINSAITVMHPTEGNDVTGTVTFTKVADGIKVSANVSGLSEGKHGFHIHKLGDCSSTDATSSGGHFNPTNMPHGSPQDEKRHAGDLGNLVADAEGKAAYERTDQLLVLNGTNSIIGRAIIIHAGEDDLTSQPTGAAGARVACGVIGIDEAE